MPIFSGAGAKPERLQRHNVRLPMAHSSAACRSVSNSGVMLLAVVCRAWGPGVLLIVAASLRFYLGCYLSQHVGQFSYFLLWAHGFPPHNLSPNTK
jgi:hypothetical protein